MKYLKLTRVGDLTNEQELAEHPEGQYMLREEVEPIIAKYQAILLELGTRMENVINHMALKVQETETYKDLYNIDEKQLPLYINDYLPESPEHFFLSCRLSKEDPFKKDLNKCIELLWDESFDVEEYKDIGYTDGEAALTATLFDLAGMPEEANKTREAIYGD